jgi:ankyrin repeat protein
MQHGADFCFQGGNAFTTLHTAAMVGNVVYYELLIAADDKGFLINAVDHLVRTPLMYAAETNSLGAAKVLIEYGANINHVDKDGANALHIASDHGCRAVIAYLLSKGVDANTRDYKGIVPIHRAAQNGDVAAVKLLLKHGADPKIKSKHLTALLVAAGNDRLPVIKLLHELGCSLADADNSGTTTLMAAASWGYVSVAQYLLKHGVAVNAVDSTGASALHTAARYCETKPEMVAMLLANGATVDLRDKHGQTPLYYATGTRHVQCAKLLLAAGADASIAVHDGSWQCLHVAVRNGQYDMVKLLLEYSSSKATANINAQCHACDSCGSCTALMLAHDPAILKLLDVYSYTAAQIAKVKGKDLIESLLTRAARDISSCYVNGAMHMKRTSTTECA